MRKHVLSFALAVVGLGVGCARSPRPSEADAGLSAIHPAAAAVSAEASHPDEEVRPVYTLGDAGIAPIAERLCRALRELPAERRAVCCSARAAQSAVGECVRTVSAALQLGGVTLREADVDRCARAAEHALTGCDWVSSLSPAAPPECQGIFHGTLQVGQPCRGALECADGLRCAGAGPTDLGVCAPPAAAGEACSRAVDPLATYARQDASDAAHPACAGYCRMGRCQSFAATGAACLSSVECGAGSECIARVCRPHEVAAKRGEPRGAEGDECEMPWDCRGACVRLPGAPKGKCASPCRG
jgi:hypothetical protein